MRKPSKGTGGKGAGRSADPPPEDFPALLAAADKDRIPQAEAWGSVVTAELATAEGITTSQEALTKIEKVMALLTT